MMSLRLSQSHGVVFTRNPKIKMPTAGKRKARSSGGLLPQRHPPFQARHPHKAISARINGAHTPKFVSQNRKAGAMTPFHAFCKTQPKTGLDVVKFTGPIRKKGAAKSPESCTQPGCHSSIEAAWK